MADFIKSDLEFILQQIFIAEAHAAGQSLSELLPNSQVPWGCVQWMAATTLTGAPVSISCSAATATTNCLAMVAMTSSMAASATTG